MKRVTVALIILGILGLSLLSYAFRHDLDNVIAKVTSSENCERLRTTNKRFANEFRFNYNEYQWSNTDDASSCEIKLTSLVSEEVRLIKLDFNSERKSSPK